MATSFTNTEIGLLIGIVACAVLIIVLLMWIFLIKKNNQQIPAVIQKDTQLNQEGNPQYPETFYGQQEYDPLGNTQGLY